MKKLKKIIKLAMAVTACLTLSVSSCIEKPVSAVVTVMTASIKEISVKKDIIAVGESIQLELIWGNGAQQEVTYSSDNENIAKIDSKGLITGIGNGKAVISAAPVSGNYKKSIEITVSDEVTASITYNTSELKLEQKLKKYDTLHYDGKNIGSSANIVNEKGSYDIAFINEKDYVLSFNAEVVGFDGLAVYLAPEGLEGVKYLDARTLKVGDIVPTDTHLLCYDYVVNGLVYPVFMPEYYDKYIGHGEINVSEIDNEKKRITLELSDSLVEAEPWCFIVIESPPAKTEYKVGEKLDLSGLKVDLNYAVGGEMYESELDKYTVVLDNVDPFEYSEIFIVDTSDFDSGKAGEYKITIGLTEEAQFEWWYCNKKSITVTVSEYVSLDDILPKTMDEYTAFLEQYGMVSVHGRYIVYCDEVNYSTGAEVIMEQLGTAEIKKIKEYSIETEKPMLPGSKSKVVCVYKAVTPGTVKVTISQGRPWEPEENKQIKDVGYYEINEELNVTETDEIDFSEYVKGDINSDGEFNVADIVMMQNYIVCKVKFDEKQVKCADMDGDGKVNVFDLCVMKRMLINNHADYAVF